VDLLILQVERDWRKHSGVQSSPGTWGHLADLRELSLIYGIPDRSHFS